MLDGEVQLLLDLMEKAEKDGRPKLHTLPYAKGRAEVDKMSEDCEAEPPDVAAIVDGTIAVPGAELKVRRYRPLGVEGESLPTLIYYHGGGWVIGNIETHDSTCRRIANKSRCQVVSVDYRLAPEHPFPTAVEDSLAAFRHIRDNADRFDADPARLAVGGDSAGGNISAVVCQACKQTGEPMPAFQMLIYPATDARHQTESRRAFAEGYFLTRDLMDWFSRAYVPAGADLADL